MSDGALKAGIAQIEITPESLLDLSGYAARVQPSIGVLDPIYVKALFLDDRATRMLWLSFDVLALSDAFVKDFRARAKSEWNIDHVLLCATHTHAAPATVDILCCGSRDPGYTDFMMERAIVAARQAISGAAGREMVFAQTDFVLARHRRGPASAHVDSRLSAIGFRKPDGSFDAVVLNYAMHPVGLGDVNRKISGDWCGSAAATLTESLPGQPIAMITNGAAGNLNPPGERQPPEVVHGFGRQIADAILPSLRAASPSKVSIRVAVDQVDVPLDWMSAEQIDLQVSQRIDQFKGTPWADRFPPAIRGWGESQKRLLAAGKGKSIRIELFAIDLGPAIVIACSGELFSRFTSILRERIDKPLFVVGYANAAFGYIASREAYTEPGYEVDDAHIFYNSFRPEPGGLEQLADRAVSLVLNSELGSV